MSKNLGIAYSAKSKKKYAKGGQIPPSAKTESRPTPESKGQSEVSRNSGDKPAHMDRATDTPERRQASKGMKTTPIKHPTMQQSPVFKMKLRDEEDDMLKSDAPTSPEDEIREPMAKGGKISRHASGEDATYDNQHEEKGINQPKEAYPHGKKQFGQSVPGTAAHKKTLEEMRSMPDPKLKGMAEGGEIDGGAEESMDHEDSIAAAIMARRDQLHAEIDSGAHDLDTAVKMAEGGQVDIDENGMEEPNDFYSLNEDAALKENYDSDLEDVSQPMDSNEHGHEIDSDDHDMVDKIRKGMKAKRQFKGK